MKETEYERKRMLTGEDYTALSDLLAGLPVSCVTQINHYYDTPDGRMRADNTTVRIRGVNGRLRGTVKRHGNDGFSTEESFGVELLPERLEKDGVTLKRQGSLTTCRKTYRLPDGFSLMLDENLYLGCQDFELELEYPAGHDARADGILLCLQALIGHKFPVSAAKSERFFARAGRIGVDPMAHP